MVDKQMTEPVVDDSKEMEPEEMKAPPQGETDDLDMESVQALYDESFGNIQEGEVVRGRIVQVSEDL